jgi:hypothetical protein
MMQGFGALAAEADQRLDLFTQPRLDAMLGVIRLACGRRSVGQVAKKGTRGRVHRAGEAPGSPRRTL